ncbi:hypothetical protein GCM10009564_51110 [Streptomyces thermogriseus]|uniref:Uncharacterized protein n=1 Tax=Streptomyces thermogriseus TaxID=75292 RepID=A0ABP4DNX8_9ACTN
MVDPVVAQRLLQRDGDMLLPDDLGERLRAIAAVQRERRHAYEVIGARRQSGPPTNTGVFAMQGPPTHPPEPTYPCCLPALGGFSRITPREGLRTEYPIPTAATSSRALPSVM